MTRERVAAERKAQGLPPKIQDLETLRRIATIFEQSDADQAKGEQVAS